MDDGNDVIQAANDEGNTADLLLMAYRTASDDLTKRLIEMALLSEGRRIAASLPIETLLAELKDTGT